LPIILTSHRTYRINYNTVLKKLLLPAVLRADSLVTLVRRISVGRLSADEIYFFLLAKLPAMAAPGIILVPPIILSASKPLCMKSSLLYNVLCLLLHGPPLFGLNHDLVSGSVELSNSFTILWVQFLLYCTSSSLYSPASRLHVPTFYYFLMGLRFSKLPGLVRLSQTLLADCFSSHTSASSFTDWPWPSCPMLP
jgi:hypothetical protein